MGKSVRDAISIAIKNSEEHVLFARRSKKKSSYPLAWSLPSAFVQNGESPEETIKRIGVEKLGVEVEAGGMFSEGKEDRGDFVLFMHDYSAKILSGTPNVVSDDYIEMKWEEPKAQLASMHEGDMGMCTRLLRQFLSE